MFRKFYFSGDFTKQFLQGNLMERLLWTLFFSVMIITLSVLGFSFLESYLSLNIAPYISYENIKKLFEALSNNKLPEKDEFYINYIYLILMVYFISSFFGYISYKLVRLTSIDCYIPVFRFKNYWHYLIKSKKINGKKNSKNKYLYTNADVLIDGKEKPELYSGYVQNYFIDSLTNKLSCIILKDAYKFISIPNNHNSDIETSINNNENIYERHKIYSEKTIYKKYIPGDILTLFDDRIININLTYVEQVIDQKQRKQDLINYTYYFLLTIITFTPWLIQHELIFTFKRKIIIGLVGFWILNNIRNYLLGILRLTENRLNFKDFILSIIFYCIPLLWFFKILSYKITILIIAIYLIIMVLLLGNKEKS